MTISSEAQQRRECYFLSKNTRTIGYLCERTWTPLTEHRHKIDFILNVDINLKGKNTFKLK